ncbi:MAG TPA: PDZ domain-containing protein, partial [Gemmataceae bacterium]
YFFLPWVWWLRRELRLSQEFLADAAAVDGASRPDEYAEFLVRLSCRLTGRRVAPLGAAGVRAGSSDLYRRVSMLLNDSEKIETRCPRRWSLLSAGGLLSLAVLLGGAGLRAGADEPAAEEKKAEKRIQVIVTPAEGEKVEKKIRVLIAEPGEGKQPGAVRVAPAKRRVAAVAGKPVRVFAVAQEDKPGAGAALEEIEKQLEQAGVPEEQKKSVLEALKKALEAAPKLKDGALQFRALPLGNVPRLGNPEMMRQIEEMRQQLQKMQEELEKEFGGFPRVFEVPAVPGVGFPKLEGVFEQPFRGAGQAFLATDQGGARLGVAINKPSEVLAEQLDLPEGQGIVIVDVQPDSAAAKAGLKANDILLELAGEKVPSDPAKFIEQVKGIEAGKEFSAVVLRKGRKETVKGLKLPEPKPAKGVFRARPEGQVRPFRFDVKPVVPAGGEASRESMSVQVRDGAFTADYSRDGVKIRLTGKAEGGEKKVESIRITDGDTDIKAKAPGEVPEKYRDAIERVLESISAE